MRVLVATDAWHPQVNGVVRTYERLALEAPNLGFEVSFLTPSAFRTIPCPSYPEIRLALASPRAIAAEIDKTRPDFIHIATEGPIGVMTRRYCRKTRHPFTTSYHTKFPEYVAARLPVPESWCYALQRRFHNGAAATFVATQSLAEELRSRGFERLTPWSRGVDTKLFRPRKARLFGRKPVFLYVGRISVEKNLRAFLDLELPGRKVLVGSGPQEAELRRLYPEAFFAGPKQGLELARAYASADVFVFPSLTDTFGLVLLEALASGVPVAAFPVSGPRDILAGNRAGAMSDDLKAAVLEALALDKAEARRLALTYSWQNSARQFIEAVLAAHHIGLPQRRRRWRHKRRRPSRGATGPSRSYSSVWGTLGGSRVSSEMVTAAPDFKETAAKNAVE